MVCLLWSSQALAAVAPDDGAVRQTVLAFYDAFNSHGFDRAADYTTDDWNHINPGGGRTQGRAAVLKELHEVHATFLKGVTDTIEEMDIRFAAPGVAIATVKSRMSTFTMPDGSQHVKEGHIRTFVVVKRAGRWLIMQDHNTTIGG
jgi:uncharacterized protein (TIGR02246 family)